MTDVNQDPLSPGQTPADPSAPKPGEKTDPALLLQSLQDEREKRRVAEEAKKQAEDTLKELQDALASGDPASAEGKLFKEQIADLTGKIATMTEENSLKDLQVAYPALKDKVSEFKEFTKQYPGVAHDKVVKIFLSENNLLEVPQPRKGLEKPAGGGRTSQPQGMTYAEADELRKNNFRKYTQLLKEGKLNDLQP